MGIRLERTDARASVQENTSQLAMGIEVGLRSKQVLTCGRGFGASPSPRIENTCKSRK